MYQHYTDKLEVTVCIIACLCFLELPGWGLVPHAFWFQHCNS